MKKTVVLLMVSLVSQGAFAGKLFCQQKMEQAALIEHIQFYNTTASLTIENFEAGPWSEAVANNSGYGIVTVGEKYQVEQFLYKVYAKQIGNSADCSIVKIEGLGLIY